MASAMQNVKVNGDQFDRLVEDHFEVDFDAFVCIHER